MIEFKNSIVITKGGTYTGNWSSDNPLVPAVTVKTTEPVIIADSFIKSKGTLIHAGSHGANITVLRTHGYGINPNVINTCNGRFFYAFKPSNVRLENNYMQSTTGINVVEFAGKGTPGETITVRFNRARNIDGRYSDGNNGYLDFNRIVDKKTGKKKEGFIRRCFFQLGKSKVENCHIEWNEVINRPLLSRVEDNINFFFSSGTKKSPIVVSNNFIRGGYTIDPRKETYEDGKFVYNWEFTGGGIICDGKGKPQPGFEKTSHIHIISNHIVATTNYGISIPNGNNNLVEGNRILACGFLNDGNYITAQNLGLVVVDRNKGKNDKPPTFFNNVAKNNLVSWVKRDKKGFVGRYDMNLKDNENPTQFNKTNKSLIENDDPQFSDFNTETLKNENKLWWKRTKDLNLKIGPDKIVSIYQILDTKPEFTGLE